MIAFTAYQEDSDFLMTAAEHHLGIRFTDRTGCRRNAMGAGQYGIWIPGASGTETDGVLRTGGMYMNKWQESLVQYFSEGIKEKRNS